MASTPLIAGDPRAASEALQTLAPDLLDQLELWFPKALTGQRSAVHAYVDLYRELAERVVDAVQKERPDLVLREGDHLTLKVETKYAHTVALELLTASCLDAPASPWVVHYGSREGVPLHLLATLREQVPESGPLWPPEGWWQARLRLQLGTSFYFAALRELGTEQPELPRIKDVFALRNSELADLFDVSRQAMTEWLEHGAPAARQPKIATVAALVDVLEHQLKSERVAGVVRRPADAYGGLTMLEMIAADRHDELLGMVSRSFDWATAA